uniref:Histone deacetylase complex subunit SAP30 Sin3 binding domain-containing protein n=1 Tax=Ciona savignyi TaxID=51511 RepID=H2YAZ2_CIOSA
MPTKHSGPYGHHHPTNPYTPRSRSPPNGVEDAARQVKREVSSPPSKRSSLVYTTPPHSKHQHPAARRADDERANRLKRKADEDEHDAGEKGALLKRKREITSDSNGSGVDEHFRRSLGDRYPKETELTQNSVSITATVEDHFQKALGNDLWSKL